MMINIIGGVPVAGEIILHYIFYHVRAVVTGSELMNRFLPACQFECFVFVGEQRKILVVHCQYRGGGI